MSSSGLVVEADLASRLQTLCKQRWYVLARFLAAKTAPVQFCIGPASWRLGVSADSPMPEKLEAIPSWYEEQWASKFRSSQRELKNLNEAALNPGRTWRSGLADQTFGTSPTYEYYPGGVAGAWEKREASPKEKIQTGMKYAPGNSTRRRL